MSGHILPGTFWPFIAARRAPILLLMRSALKTRLSADNALLAALVIVATVFGVVAFSPPDLNPDASAGEAVATLDDTANTVKRKSADGLAWDPAGRGSVLTNGDQIFTDKNAAARVKFNDGTEIDVSENSLIRIEKQGGKTTIDMEKGFVAGRVGGAGQSVTIKLGDTRVQLSKDAEIQLTVDPNDKTKSKIALTRGEASVAPAPGSGAEAVALKTDQVLSVDESGKTEVQTVRLKTATPESGARIDAGETPKITFTWESGLNGATHTVWIARDAGFTEVVARTSSTGESATLAAPPAGSYLWRVSAVDPATGKSEASLPATFTITRLATPETVAPSGGKKLQLPTGATGIPVALLWRAGEADSYEIEVARDPAFGDVISRLTAVEKTIDVPDLPPGDYHWRVRALAEEGRKRSAWSAAATFGIDRLDAPKPPTELKPLSNHRLEIGGPVAFSWSPAAGTAGYQLQIARDKAFADVVSDERLAGASHTFSPKNPGTYHWRVRALDPFDRPTAYAPQRTFVVDALVPQLVVPEDGGELTLAAKAAAIDFAWVGKGGAAAFELQIAATDDFRKPLVKERTTATSYAWENAKPGRYYWRVRAAAEVAEGGRFSEPRVFFVKDLELLPPPRLEDRYDFWRTPEPQPEAPTALLEKVLNALTLSGTARGQEDVEISWEPIEGARSYQVELARDQTFADVVLRRKEPEPRFFWKDAQLGRFYLRAASLDQWDRRGRFSKTSIVNVAFKAPELVAPADGARIDTATGRFRWRAVKSVPELTLEIARDKGFKKLVTSIAGNPSGATLPRLPDGSYHWRLKARYRADLDEVYSEPRRFSWAFLLARPKAGSAAAGLNRVELSWEAVQGADGYEVSLDDGEPQETKELRLAIPAKEGEHTLKVRATAEDAAPGAWSEVRTVKVAPPLAAPTLRAPAANQRLAANEPVKLAWLPAAHATGYEWEVERVGKDEPPRTGRVDGAQIDEATLSLPPGTWRARVRSLGAGDEASPYSSTRRFFTVDRAPKEAKAPATAARGDVTSEKRAVLTKRERLRLSAALAPSSITNAMTSTAIDNELGVRTFNSFQLGLEAFATDALALEMSFHRRSSTLYENASALSGSADQEPLPFTPQAFEARARYGFPLGRLPLSPRIEARAGYLYKTFFTYFAKSRTALGLTETSAHHVSLGGGTELRYGTSHSLVLGADYAKPLSSNPVTIVGGRYLALEAAYRRPLGPSLRLALGYRFGSARYGFRDDEHDFSGLLVETTHSLVLGLAYGF